jgi:hypothetical protein
MNMTNVQHFLVPFWLIGILLISGVGAGVIAYFACNAFITLRTYFGNDQDYSQLGQIPTIERRIYGINATCLGYGIAESITVLLLLDRGGDVSAEPFRVKCALYTQQEDSIVKYAETETLELWEQSNLTHAWYTFNFEDPKPSLEKRNYWIVALADIVMGFPCIYAGGQGGVLIQPVEYFGFPDALSNPSFFSSSVSIYCNYSITGLFMVPFILLLVVASTTSTFLIIVVHPKARFLVQERTAQPILWRSHIVFCLSRSADRDVIME